LQDDDFDLVDSPTSMPSNSQIDNAAFAEKANKHIGIAKIIDDIDKKSGESVDKMLEPLQKLVNESNSFEEIQNKLLDLYGKMDEESFSVLMQNAIVLSDLKGRSEVTDGK